MSLSARTQPSLRRRYWVALVHLSANGDSLKLEFFDPLLMRYISSKNVDLENTNPNLQEIINAFNKLPRHQTFNIALVTLHKIKNEIARDPSIALTFSHSNTKGKDHKGTVKFTIFGYATSRSSSHSHTLDDVIAFVKEKKDQQDNFYKEKIKNITSRWKESKLTSDKDRILNDFMRFYLDYTSSKETNLSNMEIIKAWINTFKSDGDNKQESPFTILTRQRRTGCSSIFNPTDTDSVTLFKEMVESNKSDSDELQTLIDGARDIKSSWCSSFKKMLGFSNASVD